MKIKLEVLLVVFFAINIVSCDVTEPIPATLEPTTELVDSIPTTPTPTISATPKSRLDIKTYTPTPTYIFPECKKTTEKEISFNEGTIILAEDNYSTL